MYRADKTVRELISAIRKLGRSQGLNNVFTTFIELFATALNAQLDPANAGKREQRYLEIEKSIAPEVMSEYTGMCAILITAAIESRDEPCDLLGRIYHELRLNNEWNGQYFTPEPICRAMAALAMGQEKPDKSVGIVKLNEPACGSGAIVLGAVWNWQRSGFDYKHNSLVIAQDIDIRCVWMTYIQMCLYDVPAVVIHGNTLTMEQWSRWYTPYAFWALSKMDHESEEAA